MPWVAALAAVAAAAIPAAISATSGSGGNAPQQRDLNAEAAASLQTQLNLAPQVYQGQRTYGPLYTDLALEQQNRLLTGRPAGQSYDESYTAWEPLHIPEGVLPMPWGNLSQSDKEYWGNVIASGNYTNVPTTPTQGTPSGGRVVTGYNKSTGEYTYAPTTGAGAMPTGGYGGEDVLRPVTKTRTVENAPAIPGLLDLFRDEIAPVSRELQTKQRETDLADYARLGPGAIASTRQINPQGTALVDKLVANAQEDLAAPGLTPRQQREVSQNIRAGQAARGFGYGSPDIFQEAMATAAEDENLRNVRAGRGLQALGANQSVYFDPFMQVFLGSTGGTGTASTGALLTGANTTGNTANAGSTLFNPMNAYASDLYNTNYNAQVASQIAAQNRNAALSGAAIGGATNILAGSLAGGYFSNPNAVRYNYGQGPS